MKICQNPTTRTLSAEISTRHFGRHVAVAARDRAGRISCYFVAVDAQLFARKLGPTTLVSVMYGGRCFEIARMSGTYRVHSARHCALLQGSESLTGPAAQQPDCFKVWCGSETIIELPLLFAGLLRPEQNLGDLVLLARAFSAALQHLELRRGASDLPPSAMLYPPAQAGKDKMSGQPLLIVPETSPAPVQGFCRAMVLLQ